MDIVTTFVEMLTGLFASKGILTGLIVLLTVLSLVSILIKRFDLLILFLAIGFILLIAPEFIDKITSVLVDNVQNIGKQ